MPVAQIIRMTKDKILETAGSLYQKGHENPAEEMYQRIKNHKEFTDLFPAAETRWKARKSAAAPAVSATPPGAPAAAPIPPEDKAKTDKAIQAEKTLETNNQKPRTTAHASTREGKPVEELTLAEIGSMSDNEFSKLPKNVRNRYLKQYGSYAWAGGSAEEQE